jgi:hypothetical protein
MKPLMIWSALVAVLFGGFAVTTNATRGTDQVFVVVDSSFPMREVWSRVPRELDRIDDRSYAEFALATEKSAVHGFQDELALGAVEPFAPCSFDEIDDYPEAADADERILVTTAGSCDTSSLDGWTIVEVSR